MTILSAARRASVAALAFAGLLAGCAGAPPLKQVLLSPPQTADTTARASAWHVQRVRVPEYLDSYDIQMRSQDYVISQMPDAKWAERLPIAITSLLQQTIDEKLRTDRARPTQVEVDIRTFEPQPSNDVLLAAHWTIIDRGTDRAVAQDNAVIRQPLGTSSSGRGRYAPADVGRAMSRAVRELGARIAAAAD